MEGYIDYTKPTGLNSDDEINFMPNGDSPVSVNEFNSGRLNCTIEDGNRMAIVNTQGNELESYVLPAGTNKTIGKVEDVENNAIIYAIYNSNSDHCVLRYNYDATFTEISTSESDWNFQEDYPVDMKVYGSGSDKELILTDNYNEPRQVNLAKLIAGTYASLDEGNSYLMKPLLDTPEILYETDNTIQSNNLRNSLFQFTYKVIFDNGQESHWSCFSRSYPVTDKSPAATLQFESSFPEKQNGYMLYVKNIFNRIKIELDFSYDNVEKVKLAVRRIDVGSGVSSLWGLYDIIDVTGTTLTYYFYNDKPWGGLDQFELNNAVLNYDIPIKIGSIEMLSNNRLSMSQYTNGYDNVDLDVTIENAVYSLIRVGLGEDAETITASNTATYFPEYTGIDTTHEINIYSQSYGLETFVLNSDSGMSSVSDVVDFFVTSIANRSVLNLTVANVSGNRVSVTNNEAFSIGVVYRKYVRIENVNTLLSGTNHYLCFNYYDEFGRIGRSNISDDCNLYVPFEVEQYDEASGVTNYIGFANKAKITISHLPPSWAVKYSIGWGGCGISEYYTVPMILKNGVFENNDKDFYFNDGLVYINLPKMLSRLHNDRWGIDYRTFDVKSGDRIRFIGTSDSTKPIASDGSTFFLLDEYVDLEILNIDVNGFVIVNHWSSYTNFSELDGDGNSEVALIQLYRPNVIIKENALIYNEITPLLDISGGYHQASGLSTEASTFGVTEQNQTGAQDCVLYVEFGNATLKSMELGSITRTSSLIHETIFGNVYSENFTTLFPSTNIDMGRINIVDKNFKQRVYNDVKYTGSYSEDGLVFNEINKSLPEYVQFIDNKFGNTIALVQDGYTLNSVQQNKITTMYVGRQETTATDGSSQLVASSTILSTPNPIGEFWGSIFKKSIVKNDRNIYGFDIYSGLPWRKSPNGAEDISYKMKNWFKNRSRQLLDEGLSNVDVLGGWDEISQMYYLTFINNLSSPETETIGFHEPTNRWFSFYSFIPELYGKIGNNRFLTFKNGSVYKHYSSTANRNEFYGSNYSTKLFAVFNDQPQLTKHFDSIEEDATDVFTMANSGDILISETFEEWTNPRDHTRHKSTMQSRMKRLEYWEGVFRGSFLRDEKTSSSTANQVDLINGRPLKGRSILMKLANSNTGKVILRLLRIKYRPSL